jgi:hypothetical protein
MIEIGERGGLRPDERTELLAVQATDLKARTDVMGVILPLAGTLLAVIFAALAIVVSLPSMSYLRMTGGSSTSPSTSSGSSSSSPSSTSPRSRANSSGTASSER